MWIKVSAGVCIMLLKQTWSQWRSTCGSAACGIITEKASAVRTIKGFRGPGSGCGSQLISFPHVFQCQNSESTNEQVDVWLWLQLHLLFDEETGPHNVLLRSVLQPYFRTAAPTGHRLRTSTKGNAASVPSVSAPSWSISFCVLSPVCDAGHIWGRTSYCRKHRVWSTALFICFGCPKLFPRFKKCATRQCSAVIDSVMALGDLMAVLLPWQQWTCFQLTYSNGCLQTAWGLQ